MSDTLCRLDIRISKEDKILLRRRCNEFDMTQTDYMRMLINLPMRMVDEGMDEKSDLFVIDRWGAVKIALQIRRLGYRYNQGVHALNAVVCHLKRDEADCMDALDALRYVSKKLETVDNEIRYVSRQLNSLVGKRFGCELFEPSRYKDSHDMQGQKCRHYETKTSR